MLYQIILKFDLRSGEKTLPAGMHLRVIISNSYGARAVDPSGEIHVIRADDFIRAR